MTEIRCKSPTCVINADQTRGRLFTLPKDSIGVESIWCPKCIEVVGHLQFYAQETADMIRTTYKEYIDTNLPSEVKTFLEAYTREILRKLNAEL